MPDVREIFELTDGKLSKEEKSLIEKAYHFAEKAHEGQKRFSGDPHFVHVFETAKNLAKLGMDAKSISAGLLHDTLEDTPTTEEEIDKEFGGDILFLIKGVTKLGSLKYRGHDRHVESLRKFFIAMANDIRVVMIKFADRLHNLRTLEFVPEEKRRRIALESIEVYAPLANRLGMGKLKGDIEDAAFPFAYPKEYEKIEELISAKKETYEKNLNEVKEKLIEELNKNKVKIKGIDYRIKHKYSLYKKLLKYGMDIDKIYDVVALRVVLNSVSDCYKVLGIIHSVWNPLPGRIKDYIAVPKPNGYRSVHTTIFTGLGGIAEIQIRTKEMHNEAAYGIAAHFTYKEQDSKKFINDKDKFKWLEELKELNHSSDDPKNFINHLKMDLFNDRIFVFTPKGDVVDLPEGSTSIDFAYLIHSDIGDHILSAKINSRISPIFAKLQNGDIVEIITKKDAHPSGKWLENAKTALAKKHIKSYLEKNSLLSRLKSFGKK